jgi:RecA/RadA recombinase
MTTTTSKTSRKPNKPKNVLETASDYVHSVLDKLEVEYALTGSAVSPGEVRQTTGLLSLDLVIGTGITTGWYTVFGPEQSCKTTLALTIMCASVTSGIPIKAAWDYEGSMSADYVENIMKQQGLPITTEELFGTRDKAGKWIVKPIIRFYSEIIGEKFFDFLAKLERALPDKRLINDEWFYIYEDTKENMSICSGKYDVAYYKKNKKLKVPAPDGLLQAIILLDSYPAMLPEKQDVDDPNSAIAVQARMFSDQLKRVKGRMKAKRIAVIGINQFRKAPMAFGNPNMEPCGEALKFYSDVRLMNTPRALSGVPYSAFGGGKQGMIMEEKSVTGEGNDVYRYIHVKAIKNKLSQPNYETWLRLWVEDTNGQARGFDPVWDVFYYLAETGQATYDKKRISLHLHKGPTIKGLTIEDFKIWVLGSTLDIKELCTYLKIKPFRIKSFCKDQFTNNIAFDLYLANKKNKFKHADSDDDGEPDHD